MSFEMMICILIQASVSIVPSLNYYYYIKDGCSETDLGYKEYKERGIQTHYEKQADLHLLIIPMLAECLLKQSLTFIYSTQITKCQALC